jgi:hypothetical protein
MMAAIHPSLRNIFSAGLASTLAVREFRSMPERLRTLLEPVEHASLLAADIAYRDLFELVGAGNSLGGVVEQLLARNEENPTSPERGPRSTAAALEPAASGSAAALVRPAAPAIPTGAARLAPLTTQLTQPPRPARASVRAVPAVRAPAGMPAASPVSQNGGASTAVTGTDVVAERKLVSESSPQIQAWSREDAARELAARVERAGLSDVWLRPAANASGPPAALPALHVHSAPENPIMEVVGRRLAPLVQTVFERSAIRDWSGGNVRQRVTDRLPADTANTSNRSTAALSSQNAAEPAEPAALWEAEGTPLRRLAAFGSTLARQAAPNDTPPVHGHTVRAAWPEALPDAPAGRADTASVSQSRLRRADLDPKRWGVAVPRESGRPRLSARIATEDEQEFAQRLASVLRQEALRSGIDPVEFES